MSERKITAESFDRGSLRTTLDTHMYRSGLSDQGRERVNSAVQAAIEHVAKEHELRRGVGGNHMEDIQHFLNNRYEDRHLLQPKERAVIESALHQHYGIEKQAA